MELISLVQEVVCWPLLTLTDRLIISFSCTLTLQKLKIKNTNKHHSKEENILQVSSRIDDQSHSKMSCTDQVCIPLGWSGSGLGIQDLSGSWCIKGTDESIVVVDLSVTLMHHVPDRSWITDPDPDHLKGMHPKIARLTTYLRVRSIQENLKLRSCRIDWAIARSIR